ncbi:hypothetical protein JK386_00865 [Nocardioides sp. zg-536]|uniref:Lipoprotein n=1 Tax=Nocardioides faecalis TaxID=2803858 RepID=A0A938Y752_9ACTN|nr:hypothetical protein [Nocardioides faecalis]MBM9458449.1 hypothetical protein [Nocardioides faecalis]QVI58464.1 hypothetical protein KG111_15955 [Nocardioides faecalis]
MNQRVRTALAVAAAGAASVACTAAVTAAVDGDGEQQIYSTYSARQIEDLWDNADQKLFVPTAMPAGAADTDEPGFQLNSINIDEVRKKEPGRRVAVSYYYSHVLSGNDEFRIYQRPENAVPDPGPCGPDDVPHITRTVDATTLTICGAGLVDTKAKNYWTTVDFTVDYDKASWLD